MDELAEELTKELICIVCPKGCHMKAELLWNGGTISVAVTGNTCKRGEVYAKTELTNPTRIVTSTVALENSYLARLPVKTSTPIPKGMIFEAMKLLNGVSVKPPIKCGDIIVKDILGKGTGASVNASFIASRSII